MAAAISNAESTVITSPVQESAMLLDAQIGSTTAELNGTLAAEDGDQEQKQQSIGDNAAVVRQGGHNESTMVWTPESLESLRLCRNRAYHKVNTKRRQHLPASLSAFMLREWQSTHRGDKFSAKYILGVYNRHFEQQHQQPQVERTTGPRKKGPKKNEKLPVQTQQQQQQQHPEDHSDKQWSEPMLEMLTQCSERARQRMKDGVLLADFSTLLHREWLLCFPQSTLTARNLKSRLTVYMRTRSEASPPSKRRKLEEATTVKVRKIRTQKTPDTLETEIEMNDAFDQEASDEVGVAESDADKTFVTDEKSETLDEVSDEFVPENGNSRILVDNEESQFGADIDFPDRACPQHWLHVFQHADREMQCSLTEQLLQIRESLKSLFPCCDLYNLKKPKGFYAEALSAWQRLHPKSDENIKSISVRFTKYDKGPNTSGNASVIERDEKGRIHWTPEVLNNLQRARQIAEEKAGESASSHMLTRKWKEEWKKLYPTLDCDWGSVVGRYKYHFGRHTSTDSINDNSKSKDSDNLEGNDDKVKGFRNWTSKMKQDLLDTCKKIRQECPTIEPGSSEFNKVLLQDFQKLHPACMESSRSIYSKVQSIEKSESQLQCKAIVTSSAVSRTSSRSSFGDDLEAQADPISAVIANDAQDISEGRANIVTNQVSNEKENEIIPAEGSNSFQDEFDGNHSFSDVSQEDEETDVKSVQGEQSCSTIQGFDDWSLVMIRDFIACMDSTRRKFATLKEQDPDGSIKLVPLLLDEWRALHPDTNDNVKTFLVKIKHLKLQKDMIKKHLCQAGLLPTMDNVNCSPSKSPLKRKSPVKSSKAAVKEAIENLGEFRWNRSMIEDVIQSRKRALELKEKGLKRGEKLSFHNLWEEEFRKVYPNSTFTSNNLSVHFWTWRKQQQKLGKMDPLYDKAYSLADTSRPQPFAPPPQAGGGTSWNAELKADLLAVGRRVQESLCNVGTPNELKVKGFSNVLHTEWRRLHPHRTDTVRGLNMMYSRMIRAGEAEDESVNAVKPTWCPWTPLHNRTLRKCVDKQNAMSPVSYAVFSQKVMEAWRKQFPASSVSSEALKQRITDLAHKQDRKSQEGSGPPKFTRTESRGNSIDSMEAAADDSVLSFGKGPNARGQMSWNKQTIRDLFNSHQKGLLTRKESLTKMSKKEAPILSSLVHEEFLRLHPYCKLTPQILMAKLYCWKNAVNKGILNLEGTTDSVAEETNSESRHSTEETEESQRIDESVNTVSKPAPYSRDIVFRTWSQEMIENLMKTKKKATIKKQQLVEEGKVDVQILDIWYDEFISLHPDYSSTKKNLMQKYKWYRSRVKKLGSATPAGKEMTLKAMVNDKFDTSPSGIKAKSIRKDLYLHIKALMEESRIFLPMKLPQEPELKRDFLALPQSTLSNHVMSLSTRPLIISPSTLILPVQNPMQQHHTQEQRLLPIPTTTTAGIGPSASQTLAQFHQKAMQQDFLKVPPLPPTQLLQAAAEHDFSELQLNLSLPAHIRTHLSPVERKEEYDQDKKDAIKLPGGATLVAVTERNADALLKPKPVEKPHVTITIGEKTKTTEDVSAAPPSLTSNMKQPIVLPINIPKFHISTISTPPPMPQLKPYGLDMSKKQPQIAIFPIQQTNNSDSRPLQTFAFAPKAIFIPSRVKARLDEHGVTDVQFIKLLQIYDKARNEYIDTLKRGYLAFFPYILGSSWRIHFPKSPMTGRKLAGIVDLYIEEKNKGKIVTPEYLSKKPCQFTIAESVLRQILTMRAEVVKEMEEDGEGKEVNTAIANVELCKRWTEAHPDIKMTTKQLISIHEMLTYDASKDTASPEIECLLSDAWKLIDRSIQDTKEDQTEQTNEGCEIFKESGMEEKYDEETVTIEQMQEWLIETQAIRKPTAISRPRYGIRNKRLFWTLVRLEDLSNCRILACRRFASYQPKYRRPSLCSFIYSAWKSLHPNTPVSMVQVVAKCISQIRYEKSLKSKKFEKIFDEWRSTCEDFSLSEDMTQVIEACDAEQNDDENDSVFGKRLKPSSLSTASRNFHDDEEVLAYIGENQRSGRGSHLVTWTPDVIRDLLTARRIARERKRDWEEWATKKYGGVGFAYSNPDITYAKIDEMFKEEWAKLRPDMGSLSIWTLVSYARKYDNMKKQLITDHWQAAEKLGTEKKLLQTTVFFENSAIPKFDLEELQNLPYVSQEMKDLLLTRQLAKTRQVEDKSKLSLTSLWEEEWFKRYPEDINKINGHFLQRRLYQMERIPENQSLVKPVLLRATAAEKIRPIPEDDELPRILPRDHIFPEDESDMSFNVHCRVNVRKTKGKSEQVLLHLQRDVFCMSKYQTDVPAVEKQSEEKVEDEDGEGLSGGRAYQERFPVKYRLAGVKSFSNYGLQGFFEKDNISCDVDQKEFHNINNFKYQLALINSPQTSHANLKL